jgi:hypothetical protein
VLDPPVLDPAVLDPPVLDPDFFVTTADHLPHSSVTLPLTCPAPLSPLKK